MKKTFVQTLVTMLGAYLSGSLPFSYLVARHYGVDVRRVGSGNVGGSNVWRTCGFGAFLVATTLDMLKGMLPTLIALRYLKLPPWSVMLTGGAAIIGHTFPIFLRFRGGKAVATSAGVLATVFPSGVFIAAISWGIAVAITRISAVGSLMAATMTTTLAIRAWLKHRLDPLYACFTVIAAVLVAILHRENIQRILAGTEHRVQRFF